MKKIFAILLATALILTFVACSKPASTTTNTAAPAATATPAAAAPVAQDTTPSTGTKDAEYDPNKTLEFDMQTSETNRIVTVGTIDKSRYTTPVLVTSFGQSTDASMLDTVMKKAGINYVYNATITADGISSYKTIVIAVGASTKGLGAAGISEAEETARASEIMKVIKEKGIEVICCHIGGSARRGTLSDTLTDMVMDQASYIILKEDANFDYKFTKYASEHNKPITLIYATKDTIDVFTNLYK